MKWLVLLVVVLVVLTVFNSTEARKPRKNRGNKGGKRMMKCKYVKPKNAGPWTDCEGGKKNKTLPLLPGQPATCNAEKILSKPCQPIRRRGDCNYDVSRSECVEGKRNITKTLTEGGDEECEEIVSFEKNCRGGERASRVRCQYRIDVDRSGCVEGGSGMVVVTKTPEETSEDCDTPIIKEKACRTTNKNCIYSRRGVTCTLENNKYVMELRLKKSLNGATCEDSMVVPCNKRKMKKINRRMKKKGQGAGPCKYKKGRWEPCDPETNMVIRQSTLRRGDPNVCNPVEVEKRRCRKGKSKNKNKGKARNKRKKANRKRKQTNRPACKYSKAPWGECDTTTNLMSREVQLRKGDTTQCNATITQTRPCRSAKKRAKACKYQRNPWSPCDAATNTVSRTLTLKSGDPAICNATKTETTRCKDKHLRQQVCKYRRTNWGDCDPVTNMKVMVKVLKSGDPATCAPTNNVETKCKRKTSPGRICKYAFENWGECNNTTNTMTRKQTLKSGNPATCPAEKINTRKCKIPCKFKNGRWSPCDPATNIMERIDTIQKGSQDFCERTRVITKKCGMGVKKGKKCKYDYGSWEDCNIDTNKRTRIRTLVSGGEDCEQEKVETKSCTRPNGGVRCFFGKWQEYGECQNGVQKKQRLVLQGGIECQRKGVKMKAC